MASRLTIKDRSERMRECANVLPPERAAKVIAKRHGEALLFKGNDFSQTDIEPALKD